MRTSLTLLQTKIATVAISENAAVLVAQAPRRERKLRRRIAKAKTAKARNTAQHRHLRSMSTRVAAVIVAARKKRRPLSPEEIVRLAERLDTGRTHPVRAVLMPKETGGVRVAWAYGLEGRAVQEIARWQLEASVSMPAWQYALGGRSTRDLVGGVAADLGSWARWILVLDLKNCYPSFDAGRLAAMLPIPTRLARSALVGERRGAIPENTPGSRPRDYADAEASWERDVRRCGTLKPVAEWAAENVVRLPVPLPVLTRGTQLSPATATCQGSAFAPLAVSVGSGDLERLLPEGATLRAWCDNLFVTARTRREAEAAREALVDALRQSPLGRLRFGFAAIRRRDWGVDLLGFHVRVVRGESRISPSRYGWARAKLRVDDAGLKDLTNGDRTLTKTRETLQSWTSSYRGCVGVEQWGQRRLEHLQAILGILLDLRSPALPQTGHEERPPPRVRERPPLARRPGAPHAEPEHR